LGFQKIIKDSNNIVAVEWADKIKKILPKRTIWVDFKFNGKNERKIKIRWKNF
jgi:tRNA threonylcarbamoyladenosine biosynthesis protein TsaE